MMEDEDDEMNRVATVRAESSFCNSAIHSIMQRSQKKMTGDRGTVSARPALPRAAWPGLLVSFFQKGYLDEKILV